MHCAVSNLHLKSSGRLPMSVIATPQETGYVKLSRSSQRDKEMAAMYVTRRGMYRDRSCIVYRLKIIQLLQMRWVQIISERPLQIWIIFGNKPSWPDIPSRNLPGETKKSQNNLHILRFSQRRNWIFRYSGMWRDAAFRSSAPPSFLGVSFRSSGNYCPVKMKHIRSFETSGSDYPMTHGLSAEEKIPMQTPS